MACSYNKKNISVLVKKVKRLHLSQASNFLELNELSELIFLKWKKIRKKLLNKLKIKSRLTFAYEAEEELVIGLFVLLNEKIINFVVNLQRS